MHVSVIFGMMGPGVSERKKKGRKEEWGGGGSMSSERVSRSWGLDVDVVVGECGGA